MSGSGRQNTGDKDWNTSARGETPAQRLDRNLSELLQELRVAQTGVQILFAFLLTLPFGARFGETSTFQRNLYVITLMCAAGATALLIAPVAVHRAVFRQHKKAQLVSVANLTTIGGLTLLAAAVIGAVLLVLEEVAGGSGAKWLAAAVAVWFLLLWLVLPLLLRRSRVEDDLPGGTTS